MAETEWSDLQDARLAVAALTARGLTAAGRSLQQTAAAGDRTAHGLSLVALMAGETGSAALELYATGRWYAGAALVRQLVEHHQLCVYFADDLLRVEAWLTSTETQLRRQFAPARLRESGGFTQTDYKAHCTWGGHPNPRGSWLVDSSQDARRELLVLDLTQHLVFIYVAFVRCIGEAVASGIDELVVSFNYIGKWRAIDPLADGVPVGGTVGESNASATTTEQRHDPH